MSGHCRVERVMTFTIGEAIPQKAIDNGRLIPGGKCESTRPVPMRGAGRSCNVSLADQPVAARKGSASRSAKHAAIAASWTLARVAASIGACLSSIGCCLDSAS